MRSKVFVVLLVFCLMFAGTALAHPFVIHPDAVRPTDNEIDSFLESHRGNEWVVYGIQYYCTTNWEWRFFLAAVPSGIEDAVYHYRKSHESRIIVGPVYSGDNWEYDILWPSGTVETRNSSVGFDHRNSKGDYSVVAWDPTTPLQAAMEGATEIMTTPVRHLAPAVMSLAVGLVGFAKGWTWLRKQLLGA